MNLLLFYSIISILVSIFVYFFCRHIGEIALIRFPFFSKKIKINRNSQKIIKFSSNLENKNNILLNDQYFIKSPKYFTHCTELFYKNTNSGIKNKISKIIDIKKTSSLMSVDAFLNNKFILSLLHEKINKSDISSILNIFQNFEYPINIILKFYNNDDFVLFYIKKNSIIKINNCDVYNKIIDYVFNSTIFAVCDDENNIYISNGFLVNYNVNQQVLSNIFGNDQNNKYYHLLNKFDNLAIVSVSSTLNKLNPC